uniref:Lactosylceramide 4-alpha-galactosyltransferase n=2 Tax=Noccaea caerulescens TaxID=107243 RepID=A0A1J3IDB1_NOCCA
MGKLSGFVVNEVNLSNIANYLDDKTLQMIHTSVDTAKLETFPQSKPDLIRLALLIKYGGIYLDASYVAVENFDWLINIGRY